MKVSGFGLGYVSAVSCACFPELGHDVIGLDTNPTKVRMINDRQSLVVEEGVNELIRAAAEAGKLQASQDAEAAVNGSDVSLISVSTPSNVNFKTDLTAVDSVIRSIAAALRTKKAHRTVVLRSTVPSGATRSWMLPIFEGGTGRKVGDRLCARDSP